MANKKTTQPIIFPSHSTAALVTDTVDYSMTKRLQFYTPEVMLLVLLRDKRLQKILTKRKIDSKGLLKELNAYVDDLERVPAKIECDPAQSAKFSEMMTEANNIATDEDSVFVLPSHYLLSIYDLDACVASTLLGKYIRENVIDDVLDDYNQECTDALDADEIEFMSAHTPFPHESHKSTEEPSDTFDESTACQLLNDDESITKRVFVGREQEVQRALMTLSKRDHGNIVFVGDSGVGKSSMMVGIIQAAKRLPKKSRLAQARFFRINAAAIVMGTTYADEIERHLSEIIVDVETDKARMAVLFADEMSELAPQNPNDNTPDTLRLLISLIEGIDVHIVTTASFEQYKRLTTHNSAVAKCFTRIDINEPPLDPDGRRMVTEASQGLLDFHHVKCDKTLIDKVIDAAQLSWSKDLGMPGRALDLLDNLAALHTLNGAGKGGDQLSADHLEELLKMMGYDSIAAQQHQGETLRELEPGILRKVFGQDEAVHGVAQSVLLAKAGLSDESKPLAAYLFVGPTGVGKTELARVLAEQLGVKLVRFDMSEYSEQHTVSKLVGSPAGYIGYDDGGLLTDAVRKNPNCVLLFDEIEKAHSAVFNLLLQTLDYAQLTDNKGQKADFSGTIIIMTSNAGARLASGAALGFGARTEKSEVMESELKKTFAPEFLNRLTQIVSFHDMSEEMAERILDRKVGELRDMLVRKKQVDFTLTDQARSFLLKEGFSARYGAREMDRAIGRHLKPALMNALLFAGVNMGDKLSIDLADGTLKASDKVKRLK